MKEFETYENKIIAETDKEVINLALECCEGRKPLFKIEDGEDDFKYSLCYYNPKLYQYQHCWGLMEKMTLKEALQHFDFLEEQFIIRILDHLNINHKIK